MSSEHNPVPHCVCQSSASRSLPQVSNPGRIVERTEPSLFSFQLEPAVASKSTEARLAGGNYPLDLVLIRTIILGSPSSACGLRFSRCHESRTGAGKWSVDKVMAERMRAWFASNDYCGTEHGYDSDTSEESPIKMGEHEPQHQVAEVGPGKRRRKGGAQ